MSSEAEKSRIFDHYRSRTATYSMLDPWVAYSIQERERAWLQLLRKRAYGEIADLRVLEVGCGDGNNLLFMLRAGARAENMQGNELLPERADVARSRLPRPIKIWEGSADEFPGEAGSFDIVIMSMVLSSVIDPALRQQICRHVWSLLRPGGGVLWYDFAFDNPRNPDVRAVPVRELKGLFDDAAVSVRRVTLAPPISRLVTRIHPALYAVFNLLPFLRTHRACWIEKYASR